MPAPPTTLTFVAEDLEISDSDADEEAGEVDAEIKSEADRTLKRSG